MKDCPFCRIPNESPYEVVEHNDHCFLVEYEEDSLLTGMMVIPFRHVASPFDLSKEEWSASQGLLQEAHRLLARTNPAGFNVGWNVGEVGGQTVPHAHLHVFARFADEPMAGKGIRHWLKSEANRRTHSG